jgi:chemotaxis protein MotB
MTISKLGIMLIVSFFLIIAACSSTPKAPKPSPCVNDLTVCNNQLQQCRDQIVSLTDRRDQLVKHLEECQLSAAEVISDKEAARLREAELRVLLQKELADKNVEIEFLKGRLTIRMLNRIMFNSGSADILPIGKNTLDKVVQALVHTKDKIRVVGHTDNVRIGMKLSAKYPSNWELSAARASSVVRYFEGQHQILPTRMEAVGLSEYHPLETNDSDDNRQRNRRVEIILTAKD